MRASVVERLMPRILALAVGALLGDAFLHLLPESYTTTPALRVGLLVMAGVLAFFMLEKWMGEHDHAHEHSAIAPIGPMSIVANSLHNFVDGMLIAGAFEVDRRLGVATFAAVALHEIPHEAANYAILLHAGYTRTKAIFVNFSVGIVAMLGAAFALSIGARFPTFPSYLLPFTAGCFVYLACSDLMPTLLRKGGIKALWSHFVMMVIGMGLMVLLLLREP
jgi:zinc and cadmium transporter